MPFFAPFRLGRFEIHGAPIGDEAVMVWAYDLTSDGIGWDGVADLDFEYVSTSRRKRARRAYQLRREMVDSLSRDSAIKCAAGGPPCADCEANGLCLALEDAKRLKMQRCSTNDRPNEMATQDDVNAQRPSAL